MCEWWYHETYLISSWILPCQYLRAVPLTLGNFLMCLIVLAFHTRDGVPITWLSPGNHWAITSQQPLDCLSLLLKISLTVAWVALMTTAYSRKHSADPFSSAVKWTIKTELTHDGTVLRFVLSITQNWNNYQRSWLAWFQRDSCWNNKLVFTHRTLDRILKTSTEGW